MIILIYMMYIGCLLVHGLYLVCTVSGDLKPLDRMFDLGLLKR